MGKKAIEQQLRAAGLRKKRARRVAKAADRARAGDRASRDVVEHDVAALRDSISAAMSHAKPPRSRSRRKATARKAAARRTPAQGSPKQRSTSTSTG